jgi:hypothetical protein
MSRDLRLKNITLEKIIPHKPKNTSETKIIMLGVCGLCQKGPSDISEYYCPSCNLGWNMIDSPFLKGSPRFKMTKSPKG